MYFMGCTRLAWYTAAIFFLCRIDSVWIRQDNRPKILAVWMYLCFAFVFVFHFCYHILYMVCFFVGFLGFFFLGVLVFWFFVFFGFFPLFLFPLQQIGIGQQTCSRQIIVFLDNLRKNIANLCTLVVPCSEGISVCLYVCISLHFTVCLRLSLRMHACM